MKRFLLFLLLIILCVTSLSGQTKAKVYIVLGSDTAIWDAMSVSSYNCTYNPELYADPSQNAFEVMSPLFRENLVDSYGTVMKLTWWMMAGNIFRYATNANIPIPNIMTLYLMKKYHQENVERFGDELSLHYHTFAWTDYDGDGRYFWNQAPNFMECFDDFNYTLAQFLLEEEVFPVSFRSGWHYMDNEWQKYLNEILPYSMHNDYPAKRLFDTEPVDNIFDWSLAPSEWIPFNPSPENYQIPGVSRGWNLRSKHLRGILNGSIIETLFKEANKGVDQVACFWGHLPEDDFKENLVKINDLLHAADAKYPHVSFEYCTAVEAMQKWQKNNDNTPPDITIEEIETSGGLLFRITSDEIIFQYRPFVAYKDIYENYMLLNSRKTGENTWETRIPIQRKTLAKIGVAVSDAFGNQTIEIKKYLPDDQYIDDESSGYQETAGSWMVINESAWGNTSRAALIVSDTVRVQFHPTVEKSGKYNISVQFPPITNAAQNISFKVYSDNELIKEAKINSFESKTWIYLMTADLDENKSNYIEMSSAETGKYLSADVIKVSPLVVERSLYVDGSPLKSFLISEYDTAYFSIKLQNRGYEELSISRIYASEKNLQFAEQNNITIPPMKNYELNYFIYSEDKLDYSDTLVIESNDLMKPITKIPFTYSVTNYFKTIDNEDLKYYKEYGEWAYSVANAYGPTSRISWLNKGPGAKAEFSVTVQKSGLFDILFILPETVNAANKALYKISSNDIVLDSFYVNQNSNSGSWQKLGSYNFTAGSLAKVEIINDGKSTEGVVLRSDAVEFQLIEETTDAGGIADKTMPEKFSLSQNYPNPFNPITKIAYSVPVEKYKLNSNPVVTIKIFDTLGREISTLVNETKPPGNYEIEFDASSFSSGVYFYRMDAGSFSAAKKCLLIK